MLREKCTLVPTTKKDPTGCQGSQVGRGATKRSQPMRYKKYPLNNIKSYLGAMKKTSANAEKKTSYNAMKKILIRRYEKDVLY